MSNMLVREIFGRPLNASDMSRGDDGTGRRIYVETSDGAVVVLRMQDLGKQHDGSYVSCFEGETPQRAKIRIESMCAAAPLESSEWRQLHNVRLAADEAALWKHLPEYGLLPWTAHLSGGYPIFPNRMEYGRYAETDMFHTISG